MIYLECCNNKLSATVEGFWMTAVATYGWPSRRRGDFGKENNGVERKMIRRWGAHFSVADLLPFGRPRIQHSLNETRTSWKNHKIRTAGNKTPIAIYQLNRERAINRGYWTGDPGDDLLTASHPSYGEDPSERLPPPDELSGGPTAPDLTEYPDVACK
ncbi:hypothetical protein C8J57DRAFT_1245817 [Mycena rebaudengoi]|nr:hypothetical protein C8J57DRAFT_1245817 [Mycena rebaudengoi]